MTDHSDGTTEVLNGSVKYDDELHEGWIPVRSPGIRFYAKQILTGVPFSFMRYGEGEWRVMHPDIAPKTHPIYNEWLDDDAADRLRSSLINYHQHPRYWPAIWHQDWYNQANHLPRIRQWLEDNELSDIPWHDGRVWRRATEQDDAFPIIDAMRKQSLPIVFIGPDKIQGVLKHFKGAQFIQVHYCHAYYDIDEIERKIINISQPALISFSVGGTAKILINDLFPEIGEWSYMIDFGAFWEGLCGKKARVYQWYLTEERLRKDWTGK